MKFKLYILANLFVFNAICQNAVLVKDIRTINTTPQEPNPDNLVSFKGYLFFTTKDNTHGNELWRSDGTEAGTTLFMDINNVGDASSNPKNLTVVGDYLYFAADDGTFGAELWKSDGTLIGTNMLKNINNTNSGSGSSNPFRIIPKNTSGFYFMADNGINGQELWQSDGTSIGTSMVADYKVGTSGIGNSDAIVINNILYFASFTGGSVDLLQSDGLTVQKIFPANNCTADADLNPTNLTNINGNLYFAAAGFCNSANTGRALWVKRPNNSNAELVKEFPTSDYTQGFVNFNNTLYFLTGFNSTQTKLWKSDGTNAGTEIVKNVDALYLYVYNGKMYFNSFGELWQSDGTTNGTALLKDIVVGSGQSWPELFKKVGNTLYFRAKPTANNQWEIYKTDGTEAGTELVHEVYPNTGSYPTNLTEVNGILYFVANDGVHGRELWRTTVPSCAANSIALSNASTTMPITAQYFYANLSCNQLITRILPNGNAPIAGDVTAKVWQFGTGYPTDLTSRHYEINPLANPTSSSGRITLYFSQEEMDDYNQENTPSYQQIGDGLLPEDPTDSYNQRKNVRIIKYSGISNNGSGVPSTYAGSPEEIDPEDFDIVYNPNDTRWEITFNSAGTGGYFLKGIFTPDCLQPNLMYSKQTGPWNLSSTWVCNRLPTSADLVIIRNGQEITVPNNYITAVANKIYMEGTAKISLGTNTKLSTSQ